MTKKKGSQNPKARQTRTLEDLLRAGEAELYGQVCWSIANRGTDRPRPGEVITLEGGDEAGDHHNKKFRLIHRSIENIEQCMGMKTCGEAVALFAEEGEVGALGRMPGWAPGSGSRLHAVWHPARRAMPRMRRSTQLREYRDEPTFCESGDPECYSVSQPESE